MSLVTGDTGSTLAAWWGPSLNPGCQCENCIKMILWVYWHKGKYLLSKNCDSLQGKLFYPNFEWNKAIITLKRNFVSGVVYHSWLAINSFHFNSKYPIIIMAQYSVARHGRFELWFSFANFQLGLMCETIAIRTPDMLNLATYNQWICCLISATRKYSMYIHRQIMGRSKSSNIQ